MGCGYASEAFLSTTRCRSGRRKRIQNCSSSLAVLERLVAMTGEHVSLSMFNSWKLVEEQPVLFLFQTKFGLQTHMFVQKHHFVAVGSCRFKLSFVGCFSAESSIGKCCEFERCGHHTQLRQELEFLSSSGGCRICSFCSHRTAKLSSRLWGERLDRDPVRLIDPDRLGVNVDPVIEGVSDSERSGSVMVHTWSTS